MALPGYACSVYRSGTPTATTAEACSLVAGLVYQITAAAKRVIDPRIAWHFKDGAVTMAYSNIVALDYQFGQVTFAAAPTTALTFSGTYLPITTSGEVVSEASSFAIDLNNALLDASVFNGAFGVAPTSGFHTRLASLFDNSLKVDTYANPSAISDLFQLTTSGNLVVVDVGLGTSSTRFRMFGKLESMSNDGDVAGLLKTSLQFKIHSQQDITVATLFTGYSFKTQ
jgi:hypothetical protein